MISDYASASDNLHAGDRGSIPGLSLTGQSRYYTERENKQILLDDRIVFYSVLAIFQPTNRTLTRLLCDDIQITITTQCLPLSINKHDNNINTVR